MKTILILLFPLLLNAQFDNLKPAPNVDDCGCLRVEVYKYTSKTQTTGQVQVFKNQITFIFGSTIKSFYQIDPWYYVDDSKKVYRLYKVNDLYYFEINKTYYGFK